MKKSSLRCIAIVLFSCSFVMAVADSKQEANWVDTWSMAADSAVPPLKERTLRQVIRTSIGGYALRLRLSNLFGSDAVTMGPVEVARHAKASAIQPGTSHRITFGGRGTVTVAKGTDVLSDPVEFPVNSLDELVVSVYVPSAAATTIHTVGMQTAYLASGEVTGAAALPDSETDDSRYFLTDMEIVASAQGRALVLVEIGRAHV